MGAPMARHLAANRLLSAVWNRTASRAHALGKELGIPTAGSPSELASLCNTIVVCVSADDDLRSVIDQALPGMRAGTVIIDTSTVSPATATEVAQGLSGAGVTFIDAPVSGGVEGAVKGTLSIMAGGDSAEISRIRPVLDAISATVTHMGPVGAGQATKAVNQVIVAGVAEAVCEALALSEKLNLPSERLLPVLRAGAAGSWFLEHRGKSMLEDSFGKGFKLSLLLKDLHICRLLARELDLDMTIVETAIGDYDKLARSGDGDNDISGLIRLKRMPASAAG